MDTMDTRDIVLLDDVVYTDYGQFDLVWVEGGGFDGGADKFFHGQENGVVGAADPSGVYLNLARRSGGSRVRITLLGSAPPPQPVDFDDVVEVSTVVPPEATARWMTWAGETSGPLPELASGTYRLRVSARGRDAGAEGEFEGAVVDEYVVEIWPASAAPDAIVRVGSENARYWHGEWGGRRSAP
jgi:hypothetical protein